MVPMTSQARLISSFVSQQQQQQQKMIEMVNLVDQLHQQAVVQL
jgi:hypothetical protein